MSPTDPSSSSPRGNVAQPWNQILAAKHFLLRKAKRFALTTTCDPATGEPQYTKAQLRDQLKTITITASAGGDNILIPALAGRKEIFEMVIWNLTAQTLTFQQGLTGSPQMVPWFQFTGFPAQTGFTLGFNGSFEQPHFVVDNNQSLVVNLGGGTILGGFIRYRVNNGTN